MATYTLLMTKSFIKDMKKLDKYAQIQIKSWIINNLENTDDPRRYGKALLGNLKDKWRYRIENYRILAIIEDEHIILHLVKVGHRRSIYK